MTSSMTVVVVEASSSVSHRIEASPPYLVSALRKNVEDLLGDVEKMVLVFQGKILRDEDFVPEECFDPDVQNIEMPREIWVAYRRRQPSPPLNAQDLPPPPPSPKIVEEKVAKPPSPRLRHFALLEELEGGKQLIDEGYGDPGAFSLLTDDILAGKPFYMRASARNQILKLVEKQGQSTTTEELLEISSGNERDEKLTLRTRAIRELIMKKVPRRAYCCERHALAVRDKLADLAQTHQKKARNQMIALLDQTDDANIIRRRVASLLKVDEILVEINKSKPAELIEIVALMAAKNEIKKVSEFEVDAVMKTLCARDSASPLSQEQLQDSYPFLAFVSS